MNNEIDIQFEQTKTDLLAKIKLGMKRNKELFFLFYRGKQNQEH